MVQQKKLKGIYLSQSTIDSIEKLCTQSGRKKRFSALAEHLIVGNIEQVDQSVVTGFKRSIANALGQLEDGRVEKAKATLRRAYDDIDDA